MSPFLQKFFFALLLFTLLFTGSAKANHITGSEITYKKIGQDSVEVTVVAYRDCNGVNLNSLLLNVKPSCTSSFNIAMSVSSTEDITPVCDTVCTRCQSSGCNSPYGFQKITLKRIIDLSSYSCCEFTLSWGICCRTASTINSSQDLYVQSIYSRCDTLPNSSPRFSNNPLLITCIGDCIMYNPGAIDDDGDSLVYSITCPLKSAGSPVSYKTNYSCDKPFYFFGFPNKNLSFSPPQCRGFHLDSLMGTIRARPMQATVAVIAIKVEEYRNGVKIGEVTRDFQLIATACPSNDAPDVTGINGSSQFSVTACPGEQLCFDINSSDQNSNDSVQIDWNAGIPGATFNISQNGKYQDGTFCWTPDSSHVRNNPYFFTVTAKDNNCPIPGVTDRVYMITVKDNPPVAGSISTTVDSCNLVSFFSGVDTSITNVYFEWFGEGGFSSTARNPVHRYDSAGTYWYYLRIRSTDSDCEGFYDSALVTVAKPLQVYMPADTLVCPESFVNFSATASGNYPPYSYLWSTNDSASSITVNPSTATTYNLTVTDSIGCTVTDSVVVDVYMPSLQVNAGKDIAECVSVDSIKLSGIPAGGTWSGSGISGEYLLPSTAGTGSYALVYEIIDSNSCGVKDTILAEIFALPTISAGKDVVVWSRSSAYNLSGIPSGGMWQGAGVSQNQFDPVTTGTGSYNLSYNYTDGNGCTNSDTMVMMVISPIPFTTNIPSSFCINSAPVKLTTTPPGGLFTGAGVSDTSGEYWFNPATAGTGDHTIDVWRIDSNNCSSIISETIKINPLPTVDAGSYADFCDNDANLQLSGTPTGGKGTGVTGNILSPSLAGEGIFWLTYTFTDANSCSASDSTQINVHKAPTADFENSPIIGVPPLKVNFTNKSTGNNLRYVWFMGDPFNYSTTTENPDFTYRDTNRTYDITLIATDSVTGCADTFICQGCVIVLEPVGIEKNTPQKFKVYPNPAQNEMYIEGEEAIIKVHIVDFSGKTVIDIAGSDERRLQLNTSTLAAGNYIIYITSKKGVAMKKLVIGR